MTDRLSVAFGASGGIGGALGAELDELGLRLRAVTLHTLLKEH